MKGQKQETGSKKQESGIENQESGIKNPEGWTAAVDSHKISGPTVLPFKLYIPPSPRRSGRKISRHPATGLTLTCTRILPSRLHGPSTSNLAVELRDVAPGGLRFVASEPLQVPCPVHLQVREERSGSSLQARGETTWTETRRENGKDVILVGARFTEVLTPPAQSAWYFEGRFAPPPAAKRAPKPRAAKRFSIPDCGVTLERDHRFRKSERAGNLASRLLDLSRSGAQVVCVDPVSRGERMRLTVDFRTFNDIFTAEAETVWSRSSAAAGNRDWRVGLSFGELSHAQRRQLQTLESWFQGR
jgi:hypothetical protein